MNKTEKDIKDVYKKIKALSDSLEKLNVKRHLKQDKDLIDMLPNTRWWLEYDYTCLCLEDSHYEHST